MRVFVFLTGTLITAGYFRVIPALSGVADVPMPLMAGGIVTAGMIYMLAKVEP